MNISLPFSFDVHPYFPIVHRFYPAPASAGKTILKAQASPTTGFFRPTSKGVLLLGTGKEDCGFSMMVCACCKGEGSRHYMERGVLARVWEVDKGG